MSVENQSLRAILVAVQNSTRSFFSDELSGDMNCKFYLSNEESCPLSLHCSWVSELQGQARMDIHFVVSFSV